VTALTVIRSGPLTLVQDRGRPGHAHLGVGTAGAMDRAALALGNRLVGNDADAAGLEILLGDLELESDLPLWLAVTGARGEVVAGGLRVEPNTATLLPAGERLVVPAAERGIRYYLAVRGGLALPRVLGSRSRDTLAGLGPEPLAADDILPIGPEPAAPIPSVDVVPVDPPPPDAVTLLLRPGPRRDWFGAASWESLFEADWTVSPRSDRTGVRLEGPPLERTDARELPSEGMLPGAIQISPDGAPTILAVDHPVTGGYPVIAVVTDASLDALAQLRPGQGVRFRLATGRSLQLPE
jgi:biotin-dependent carboxylase-like uncharacterized protein